MIEGHYDTFDRAKFTFIESIYDGIGKADAAAEYYFASLNLQRHGYDLNNQDETLLKMANIILKEEVDLEPDEAIHDPWFPQSQYFTGEETVQNPSLQPSRVVAPEPGQPFTGANIQMNPGDPNSDSHHDIDYFGSSLFPLHGDKMADHVAGFYLGDKYDEKTHSEKSAHVENKFFNNHTTPNEEEHLESSFLTDRAHYGKLADDMTNHDIYQRHFDDWKRKNDPLVRLMTEQMHAQGVFDDEEINHRLAIKHMEEAKEGWKDNLKFTDYLLGLEWTTPEERQKLYEHLIKHGGSKKDTPLKLRGGNDWMPRLIANFHQRFGPIYDHWIGKAHIPGFNTKARKERMPSKGREPGPMENKEAFSAVGQDGFQRALEYAQQMGALDEELDVGKIPFLQEDTTDDGKYVVRGLQLRKPTRKTTEMVGETAGSDYRTLLALLGADENGKLHAAGQHPLYKENWNPEEGPFTQEEVDKILSEAVDKLPGEKFIYTNASTSYAQDVLSRIGLSGKFKDIFDIHDAKFLPKPDMRSYHKMVDKFSIDPKSSVMVEDIAGNLNPAAKLGMTTVWVPTDTVWSENDIAQENIHHVTENLPQWLAGIAKQLD